MTTLKKTAQIFVAIVVAWLLLGTATGAQESGYIRVMTAKGQMAGESIDPAYLAWIPFRSASMPSQWEMEGMSQDSSVSSTPATTDAKGAGSAHATSSASNVVYRPVVIVKYRDKSSLGLLGAMTSHQVLPEVDIVFTSKNGQATRRYKLTDASVISIRAGGTSDDGDAPMEQVRFNYAKLELEK
ncbi:MAG: type VI secretion system tube protein Hcp [Candidatus Acidiferrales bacterium]|jgi:type VI protein secretion system component Hcp